MMSTAVFLVAVALGQVQADRPVTDAEKQEFLELLATLPSKGEFFTDEAVLKAIPYTRVLLALDEKDLGKRDLYPFLALSGGLLGHEEPRQYAIKNFAKIAHPTLKLAWASALFTGGAASPEIITYLRKALDSKADARRLAEMSGPWFHELRGQVIRASEAGQRMKVGLVKRHSTDVFPDYGGGFSYTNRTFVFTAGQRVYAVRPLEQRGELITYDLVKGTTNRRVVPQPEGFNPSNDFLRYFNEPALSINSRGNRFFRWTIEGNGALGVLGDGSNALRVRRVKRYLADSVVLAAPDGSWHLIQEGAGEDLKVDAIGQDLSLTRLGTIRWHPSSTILDARFISPSVLHLFCREDREGRRRLRLVDFDVKERKPLHSRETLRLDEMVWGEGGTILQLGDGSLHYLWGTNDRRRRGQATGLYYQAEADTTVLKIADGYHHRAIAVGDRIVICYSLENAPDKVFFRVIRYGTLGPVSELTVAKGRDHNLWSEYMVLYSEADRIWFVNTLTPNALYKLKLVDVKNP